MREIARRERSISNGSTRSNVHLTALLFWEYTLLFAIFFVLVFSPFWLYGRSFLWSTDGTSQDLSGMLYARSWIRSILKGLLRGNADIPLWDLNIGFGDRVIGSNIGYNLTTNLYALLPEAALGSFLVIRVAVMLYLSGLSFLAFGRTRVRDRAGLLLGCLLYAFSGYTLYFSIRHYFFLRLFVALPLLLLCVDRIFEGKWSWLFVIIVALEGMNGTYMLLMITLPAVIYALFHYFELPSESRERCGGFGRILLRHVIQYAAGLCLAAISILPNLVQLFDSSRVSAQEGMNLLHWDRQVYTDFVGAIIDPQTVSIQGIIAVSGLSFTGICYLIHTRERRHRLLLGQLLLYTVAFLVPALTLVFSGMAGKTQRWCFVYPLWTSLAAACALPGLFEDDGRGRRVCLHAYLGYVALYLAVAIWKGQEISICVMITLVSVVLALEVMASRWGKDRKRLAVAVLLALVVVEMTAKSYYLYSPQYTDYITSFIDGERVPAIGTDNASDALELAGDDGLYRTDVVTLPRSKKEYQVNYGPRNHVNGLSSYYSFNGERTIAYSLDLGNAQQKVAFKIMDLDQRTVLDELAAVKYVATLANGVDRVPFGYELVGSRKKKLSDGKRTREYLYRNDYALPLAYAYGSWVSREDYDALPTNRKEQAMLQGVVLEEEVPLERTDLAFDDRVMLDHDAMMAALREAAEGNDDLEITGDGVFRVTGKNCSLTLPIEEAEGEICLLLDNADYRSVNFAREEADRLIREDSSRLAIANALREARKWRPATATVITASSGALSDDVALQAPNAQYYMGSRDVLLNLGFGRTEKELTLNFYAVGEYRFDSIRLICQPMDAYPEKVAPLLERQAREVRIDGDAVTVEFDLKESAFACLAVPYSRDWSATVDGERAEILPANGMYMGVMLPAGEHTIVYRYAMRGFREGTVLSLATLIGLVVFGIARRARRRGH